MLQKANELKAAGVDVISFSVGEPDFDTPDSIKAAACKAIEENYTKYSPTPGYPWLKKAICEKLKRENGLDYTPAQICVSTGSKQALCNTLLAVVDDGDEVLTPTPCWGSYQQMVILAGGTPVEIFGGIENDYKITAAQLEAAITPRTKALMICSPSNPTGAVYSREELSALVEVLEKHPRIVVLSDEVYEHLDYSGKFVSLGSFSQLRERLVITNGVSKAYAMTGWRLGYMAGPEAIVKACQKIQDQYTSGACSVSQKAAEAALNGPKDDLVKMREAYIRRRELVTRLLREIPGLEVNFPDGAFYSFIKCASFNGRKWTNAAGEEKVIRGGDDLVMYLLEKAHVASVGGGFFGAPDYFRISYATSDECIIEGVARIKKALAEL